MEKAFVQVFGQKTYQRYKKSHGGSESCTHFFNGSQDNNSQEPNCKEEEEDDQGITKRLEELKVQEDADDWDDIYASD